MQAYRDDLAYIHDVGFGEFSLQATPGLLEILRVGGITQGLIVDLGCGSGLWARELTRAGYNVLGVDISAAMIALARKKVPGACFYRGSYFQVQLPQCEAVTSLGECINYLFDRDNTRMQLSQLFHHVYEVLSPGGIFLFDVLEPGYGRRSNVDRNYWEGKDWVALVRTEEDEERERLTRHIITFRKIGKFYRRGEEVHYLQLYKGADIAKILRAVGFRVRLLRGYGQLRFKRAHIGFLARKPRRETAAGQAFCAPGDSGPSYRQPVCGGYGHPNKGEGGLRP